MFKKYQDSFYIFISHIMEPRHDVTCSWLYDVLFFVIVLNYVCAVIWLDMFLMRVALRMTKKEMTRRNDETDYFI